MFRSAAHVGKGVKQHTGISNCIKRLIWEKPVFVMYRVTRPYENVIYVKHALHGKKRTREQATRES